MKEEDKKIAVYWYCGHYVGPPKWHGDFFEPDECGTGFETEESLVDWEGKWCRAICPSCRAELHQKWDCPELGGEP